MSSDPLSQRLINVRLRVDIDVSLCVRKKYLRGIKNFNEIRGEASSGACCCDTSNFKTKRN